MTTRRDWLIAVATTGFTTAVVLLLPQIIRVALAITGRI